MPVPTERVTVEHPLRVIAVACAIALLSIWACLEHYNAAKLFRDGGGDPYRVEAQIERLGPATTVLPEAVTTGYISDVPFEEVRGSAGFFGAQYALAPRLLVEFPKTARPDWVLGNFSGPPDLGAIERDNGLVLVRDLGRGVMVFRRSGR